MRYKTVVGAVPDVDEEINALAQNGWQVHTFECIGSLQIDEDTETPMLAYLMFRDEPIEEKTDRPPRRVIGRHV